MYSLPKSCLPSTHEPPAEEAHETPHDSDDSDGDPRYGACAEAALVRASAIVSAVCLDIASNSPGRTGWLLAAQIVWYAFNASIVLVARYALCSGLIVSREAR